MDKKRRTVSKKVKSNKPKGKFKKIVTNKYFIIVATILISILLWFQVIRPMFDKMRPLSFLVVGSDIFELQSIQILEAFKALDKYEVVIGPAKDGGYYLLGLKKMYPEIFNNKNWGTETIFQETMQDLNNVDVHLLVELNDIDTYDDLKQHQELLKHIQLND